jgi:hypothetical protein
MTVRHVDAREVPLPFTLAQGSGITAVSSGSARGAHALTREP